jgi:hypothetical protein
MVKTSEIGGLISAIAAFFFFSQSNFLCFWWWDSWKICGNEFALFLLGFWNWNWVFFIGFFVGFLIGGIFEKLVKMFLFFFC